MKILVFNSSLRLGGAESMSIELANALGSAGSEVHFAAADGPLRANIAPSIEYVNTPHPARSPLPAVAALAAHLSGFRPDVIHSHGGVCSIVAALAARRSGTSPVRVLTHHSRIFRRAPGSISGWVMRRCNDHFVAISEYKRDALVGCGIDPSRVSLVPNFVDATAMAARADAINKVQVRASLGIGAGDPVVAMAARVIPAKGFDRFIRILARVATKMDRPVHGLIIGDGPAMASVRQIAATESGIAVMHFLGHQNDVVPFLAASDCALFPSSHPEVLPMFLIESAAVGLPVVCSDIQGNRDVVEHEKSGFVVAGGDEEEAHRVATVLEDRSVAAALAVGARAVAMRRFDKQKVVADTRLIYEQLLRSRSGN